MELNQILNSNQTERKMVKTKTESQKQILFQYFNSNQHKWSSQEIQNLANKTGLEYREVYKWNHYQLSKLSDNLMQMKNNVLDKPKIEKSTINQSLNDSISANSMSNNKSVTKHLNNDQNMQIPSQQFQFQQLQPGKPFSLQQQNQQLFPKLIPIQEAMLNNNNHNYNLEETLINKIPQMPVSQDQIYQVLKYCFQLDNWIKDNKDVIQKVEKQNNGITDLPSITQTTQQKKQIIQYYHQLILWQSENQNQILKEVSNLDKNKNQQSNIENQNQLNLKNSNQQLQQQQNQQQSQINQLKDQIQFNSDFNETLPKQNHQQLQQISQQDKPPQILKQEEMQKNSFDKSCDQNITLQSETLFSQDTNDLDKNDDSLMKFNKLSNNSKKIHKSNNNINEQDKNINFLN